jgi:catechol 2,3-dioxygenase-like lactoylglutathione lyase family enzyme
MPELLAGHPPMKVNALDHVNIITADLEGTTRFYADLFDLDIRNAPPPLPPHQAKWAYDSNDNAILHINSLDCPRTYPRDVAPGPTGAIHHVAFNCSGYDDMIARLQARGQPYETRHIESIKLTQIFTLDPNGVLLELNFWAS